MNQFKFKLGITAKSIITGIEGIVVSRAEYLTGCNRYSLQPKKLDQNGNQKEWVHFDENELIQVGIKEIMLDKEKTKGSPRLMTPKR